MLLHKWSVACRDFALSLTAVPMLAVCVRLCMTFHGWELSLPVMPARLVWCVWWLAVSGSSGWSWHLPSHVLLFYTIHLIHRVLGETRTSTILEQCRERKRDEGMVLVTLTTLRAISLHCSTTYVLLSHSHSFHTILHAMILGVAVSMCCAVVLWCVGVLQYINVLEC